MFGGHLGTCLIELGYVDERTLARTLAAIHEVRCARPEMLEDIPREIVQSLPVEEVRRRHAVPFGSTERALHVASVHPSHLRGVAAIVRRRVVPYVAPEISIVAALEKYYGIPRRRRYLTVPYAGIGAGQAKRSPSKLDDEAAVHEPPAEDPAAPAVRSAPVGPLARRMSRVESHGELGEALLDFVSARTERSILFDVDAERAIPVNWRGAGLEPERVARARFALTPRSIFGLSTDALYYRGPLPLDFDCPSFYGALGVPTPREVLVLPLYGESRLEAVLYGDGERIDDVDETWLALLDQVGLALRMLDCKRQLATAD
jgi:hypothetical protein